MAGDRADGDASHRLDARVLRFRSKPSRDDADGLAEDLLAAGRSRDVIDIVDQAAKAGVSTRRSTLLLCQALVAEGELERAQSALLSLAKAAPGDKEPLRVLGEIMLKRGDPVRAAKVLQRALSIDPKDTAIAELRQRAERLARHAASEQNEQVEEPTARDLEEFGELEAVATTIWQTKPPPPAPAASAPPVARSKPPASSLPPAPGRAMSSAPPPVAPRSAPPPLRSNPPPLHSSARPGSLPPAPFAPSASAPPPAMRSFDTGGFGGVEPPTAIEVPNLIGGQNAGRPEDIDANLATLERLGIFEPPARRGAGAWARDDEIERTGSKLGRTFVIVWTLAVVLAGGGYFGWRHWVEKRHAEAAALVRDARSMAEVGDHESLVAAERTLVNARELDAHSSDVPSALLLVHVERALEDGSFETGFLRATVRRVKNAHGDRALTDAAEAVLSAADGSPNQARLLIERALSGHERDGALRYIAGRLEQRLGGERAEEHLRAATEGNPALNAAAIALAELQEEKGHRDEAIRTLDRVLEHSRDHLRARAWKELMLAASREPADGLRALGTLAARLEKGAPIDRVLVGLTRARLLLRSGDRAGAHHALDDAARIGSSEPRVLALLARESMAAGKLDVARFAAAAAVERAASNAEYRKLYARVLIERRDATMALAALERMVDDPDVVVLRARAALVSGLAQHLTTARAPLEALVRANEQTDVATRALLLRVRARLENGRDVLSDARALATSAPADAAALLALGEAALTAGQASDAVAALERAVTSAPADPEANYWLGEARRAAGSAEGAEQSYRRSLALLADFADAKAGLASLLLARGRWQDADALYQELTRRNGAVRGLPMSLVGRLGRAEALLGQNDIDGAETQLDGVGEEDRATTAARIVAARIALAKARPEEAVSELLPLRGTDAATGEALAVLGEALAKAGKLDDAFDVLNEAGERQAGLPEAYMGHALVAVLDNRGRDAFSDLERAQAALARVIRPPGFRAAILVLTGRARMQGPRPDLDSAREALLLATQVDGAPAEAFYWLGAASERGFPQDAQAAYRRYLDMAPRGEYAARARRAAH